MTHEHTYRVSGIERVARRYGVELIDLEQETQKKSIWVLFKPKFTENHWRLIISSIFLS